MKKNIIGTLMLTVMIMLTAVFLISCAQVKEMEVADLIFKNGVIYTADNADTVVEALAVKDGKIIAVGNNADIEGYLDDQTEVIDLEGKMVVPGFIDSHLHVPGKALTDLYNISLNWTDDKASLLADIRDFVENNSGLNAYYGSGWSVGAFDGEEATRGPKKEHLDAISSDKPIVLRSYDGHSAWVNSKALELAGITSDTPNPEGGVIEKDPATGELWGTLKGAAAALLPKREYSSEQLKEGVRAFQKFMHSLGYTSVYNAGWTGWNIKMYDILQELADNGELKMWVRSGTKLDIREGEPLDEQIARVVQLSQTYDSDLFKVIGAGEVFIDGVVEGGTAKLLEPYEAAAGMGEDYYGIYYWEDMDALKETIRQLNSKGLQIHIHSIGDRATRDALDAFEYALGKEPGDHRNVITHLQLVSPEDIPRFKELGVIANVHPWWHLKEPGWWEEVDYRFLGDRAEYEYPLQSLIDAGAMITIASDYPVTPVPNPLWAIETGITRNLNNAEFYGVDDITNMDDPTWLLNKDERASLIDLLRAFTINNAFALSLEKKTGSIEVGKYADMVVLDQDLFNINPLQIDGVKILKTIFRGEVVYNFQ